MHTMKKLIAIASFITSISLVTSGCSNMSSSQQSTLSGGAIGAAAGAIGTAALGGAAIWGAVGGAAVGAAGGYVYDKYEKD